jgi:hypothetical protein
MEKISLLVVDVVDCGMLAGEMLVVGVDGSLLCCGELGALHSEVGSWIETII